MEKKNEMGAGPSQPRALTSIQPRASTSRQRNSTSSSVCGDTEFVPRDTQSDIQPTPRRMGSSQPTASQTYATTQSSSICGDTTAVSIIQQRRCKLGLIGEWEERKLIQEESHLLVLERMLLLVNCHLCQAKKSHKVLLVLLLLMEYIKRLLLILVFTLIQQLEHKCLILVHQGRGFYMVG